MGTETTSLTTNVKNKTFSGVGNLIKLLPTGTVFLFQFLNPVLTNNGSCSAVNKSLDAVLVVLCAFSCCFACFTDSYVDSDGNIHYGVITATGIWPTTATDSGSVDLSKYKLRFGDFVHAFFSVTVFAGLSLLDSNTVRCFYPQFLSEQKILLQVLPPVIGVISGGVFMLFPNSRHGIGYPSPSTSTSTSSIES
ncbi:protein DMP2 [Humulus lupulus]|uniref:protein DMP2 n=1 Tax=Humulus lupulus TaxID=3486 RepID=UPI002B416ACD|nr:protein DMP2 [Humulus lupulus]